MHLRPGHHRDCRDRCAPGCRRAAFHGWLDGPLPGRDERVHERIRDRREALMRGEIPA